GVHDRRAGRLPARAELPAEHRRHLRRDPAARGDRHRRLPACRWRRATRNTLAHAVDPAAPALPAHGGLLGPRCSRIDQRRRRMKRAIGAAAVVAAMLALAGAALSAPSPSAAPVAKLTT